MFLLGYEAAIFKQSKIDTKGGIRHRLLMTTENAFTSLGLAHCLVGFRKSTTLEGMKYDLKWDTFEFMKYYDCNDGLFLMQKCLGLESRESDGLIVNHNFSWMIFPTINSKPINDKESIFSLS